jgi:hypothetical protein
MRKGKKIFWIIVAILVVITGSVFYFKYLFVFGEGVKTGHLNYAVKKGNIFKTYEGKLIQSGIKSPVAGSIQSYEFEFSIANERVFKILEMNSGKTFDLHYKEYHGSLPWRGNTRYVVDSIMAMRSE